MQSTILPINHIERKPGVMGGIPVIAGRRIAVQNIVIGYLEHDLSPEEITQHYNGLTLAQVHAALSYYYDHKEEIESLIREEDEAAMRLSQPPSPEMRAKFEARFGHPSDSEEVMTAPEVAEEFGVAEQTVRRAASRGWIPARKSGAAWLIRRSDAAARWGSRPR